MANSFVHVHLVALRYFSETVRSGSMRQAAEQLSVAPSAVNRQILKLEEQLQCRLFERRAAGVRLTAAGEVLYQYVRQLDRDLERAIAQIDDLRGLRRGHVRLGCEAGIARDFLPNVLAAFHQANPAVTHTIEVGDAETIMTRIAADEIDIGLAMSPLPRAEVALAGRVEVPVGLVAPPQSALAGQGKVALHDLVGVRLIRAADSLGAGTWQKQIEAAAPSATIVETNTVDLIPPLVKAGLGIGVRSPVGIMADVRRGELAFAALIDPAVRNPSLVLQVRAGRILSTAGALMLEMMRAALPEFSRDIWDMVGLPQPEGGVSRGAS
ncbi:transcriptional regulator LysR family protein [Ketogulonicigenium robustum]|uniref:Transcriptional regulator LysR family protein n=1 Tax=Ketogulonicigenium robustum TaxID=92947 RepID=A0A1W6NW43_9RHOB|nr:LysR family transcriptional regulator [Ketogulonicigenium robustum]ARO13435.1 transcriptional regulator LysR family protein [Ketogulonicigenium robustum]